MAIIKSGGLGFSFKGENIRGNCQNSFKTSRKIALNSRNLTKFPLSLDSTWHLKPHSIAVSGELKLEILVVMVVPLQWMVNFASVL